MAGIKSGEVEGGEGAAARPTLSLKDLERPQRRKKSDAVSSASSGGVSSTAASPVAQPARRIGAHFKDPVGKGADDTAFWVAEEDTFESVGFTQAFRARRLLHSEETEYQRLEVYETEHWGNLMVLDGIFQNTEADEFAYHEMQAHVPLFAHPNPKRVLIIGGGDGGVAREVLKHDCVEEVVLVDIDERVTAVSRKFFPKIAAALDDPRLTVLHRCGAAFMREAATAIAAAVAAPFDVICVDSSDPIGPNEVLFDEEFLKNLRQVLAPGGIGVREGESMWLHPHTIRRQLQMTQRIFGNADYYHHYIPTYAGGCLGMIIFGKPDADGKLPQLTQPLEARVAAQFHNAGTRYYSPEIHRAAFVKPNFWDPDGPTPTLNNSDY